MPIGLLCASLAAAERHQVTSEGVDRYFWVQVPTVAPPANGWPIVLSFHGWCGTATEQAESDGLRRRAETSAVIVHPEGYSDPTDCGDHACSAWQSFNGGGSAGVESGGSDGPICRASDVSSDGWQCYASCKAKGYCVDKCRWSHCLDDAAFTRAILEYLRRTVSVGVDASRIYATGHSNGAVVLYGLGADPQTAPLLAAVAPVAGLPSNGFNVGAPSNTRLRYLEVQGINDDYVQPFPTRGSGRPDRSFSPDYGWYYSAWENTTNLWAAQRGVAKALRTHLQTKSDLFNCSGWNYEGSSPVVGNGTAVATCFYDGGHSSPSASWDLVLHFFGLESGGGGSSSCASLGCGNHDETCWCNTVCEQHGDCCSDFATVCKGRCPKCGGYTCDEWIAWDPSRYSCPELERGYGCDCNGCQC